MEYKRVYIPRDQVLTLSPDEFVKRMDWMVNHVCAHYGSFDQTLNADCRHHVIMTMLKLRERYDPSRGCSFEQWCKQYLIKALVEYRIKMKSPVSISEWTVRHGIPIPGSTPVDTVCLPCDLQGGVVPGIVDDSICDNDDSRVLASAATRVMDAIAGFEPGLRQLMLDWLGDTVLMRGQRRKYKTKAFSEALALLKAEAGSHVIETLRSESRACNFVNYDGITAVVDNDAMAEDDDEAIDDEDQE